MKRILVVDDNRLERKILTHIIKTAFRDQVTIDDSEDGEQALLNMGRCSYDLVITDIIMPRIEGIELIRLIKQSYTNCKILAISGSNPYYLYLAKMLGIQGVFTKPVNKEKLIQTIGVNLTIHHEFGRIPA
jgi:two-component system response regulator YesN